MSVNTVQNDGSLSRVAGGTLYADAPIGTIVPFGGSTVPNGYLLCDGAEVLKTTYAELYAAIGDSFGTASVSTKFVLPDLRESVPKGAGLTGKTVGNHLDADGLAVGEFLDDRFQNHNHMINKPDGTSGPYYGIGASSTNTLDYTEGGGIMQVSDQRDYRYGATTEVKSVGVNYIIKAKMVALPADFLAKVQPKTLDTPLTIGGVSQTTVEGALGALQSAKVDSSTLGRFKTSTVTLSPRTQRTISFSNVAKRVRIDIDSTGANNNTQFHGVLVGYNEMTSNRLIGLYKRGTNGLLASMGSYELTIANPSETATDTVIFTFYNLAGNITMTISDESAITLTEMGDGWQEFVTKSDLTPIEITGTGTTGLGFTAKKSGNVVTVYLYCTADVSGGQSISFGTLPTEYRPPRNVKFLIHSNNGSLDPTQGMFADISSYNGGIASYSYVALTSGQCGTVTYIVD